MGRTVAMIFRDRPTQWGLRGDPYLWGDLEDHFSNVFLPYPKEDFEEELHSFIEKVTGTKLTIDVEVHVPKYHHHGMSAGRISGWFWIEHGIPLLISRLDDVNKQYGNP
ncbi:hypothetical protein [Alicyclobacillus acidiphilus]|uniref:hypothetical protein n=1 Tax=Alicyclobacillus acidiphilus TaxID=182455 RepID=UPI0008357EF2|nr:hypothetical protein [Alicyclobacillus acidiphilus]